MSILQLIDFDDHSYVNPYINDDEFRMSLITFLDAKFQVEGKYPNLKRIQEAYPKKSEQEIKDALDYAAVPLSNRGLPPYTKHSSKEDAALDPMFVLACSKVLDFNDKRSLPAKLKELGIGTRQWNNWLKLRTYKIFFQTQLDTLFDKDLDNNAKLSIARAVEAGDLQTIRFYYELTDKYRPQEAAVQNLTLLISQLMEILAKYVTADILVKIADEIERNKITLNPLIEASIIEIEQGAKDE